MLELLNLHAAAWLILNRLDLCYEDYELSCRIVSEQADRGKEPDIYYHIAYRNRHTTVAMINGNESASPQLALQSFETAALVEAEKIKRKF